MQTGALSTNTWPTQGFPTVVRLIVYLFPGYVVDFPSLFRVSIPVCYILQGRVAAPIGTPHQLSVIPAESPSKRMHSAARCKGCFGSGKVTWSETTTRKQRTTDLHDGGVDEVKKTVFCGPVASTPEPILAKKLSSLSLSRPYTAMSGASGFSGSMTSWEFNLSSPEKEISEKPSKPKKRRMPSPDQNTFPLDLSGLRPISAPGMARTQTKWSRRARFVWFTGKDKIRQASVEHYRYVIVGGGIAAGYAANEFVKYGIRHNEVCIISREDVPPYERSQLMANYFEAGQPLSSMYTCSSLGQSQRHNPNWYQSHGIRLMLSTEVTSVDFGSQFVSTNQDIIVRYDSLIIATGCEPVRMAEAAGIGNIFYLSGYKDAGLIRNAIQMRCREVLIVGIGYIGAEMAAFMARRGLSVTLVGTKPSLETHFCDQVSNHIIQYLESLGIAVIKNERVVKFEADSTGLVRQALLSSGAVVPCDVCVVCIGRAPVLIKGFRDQLDFVSGYIRVDKNLLTNWKHVYAIGDISACPTSMTQKRRMYPYASHARQSAAHCVRHVLGKTSAAYDYVPSIRCHLGDVSWSFWGINQSSIVVNTHGDQLTGYWTFCRRLVGIFMWDPCEEDEERMRQIVELKPTIDLQRLHNTGVREAYARLFAPRVSKLKAAVIGTDAMLSLRMRSSRRLATSPSHSSDSRGRRRSLRSSIFVSCSGKSSVGSLGFDLLPEVGEDSATPQKKKDFGNYVPAGGIVGPE
eukprot:Rmarinus@m.12019